MPTADKKNFIVEKGIELEGGFTLKNVTTTSLIDSAGATSVLTDSSNSASIISAAGGNIVKGYDSSNLLPLSNNTTGELNYVTETNRLYLWNGSGWYNIATVNTTPTMTTTPDSNYSMNSVGASLIITLVATDPEGLPITYSATSDSSSTFVTISQDSGVFTITPLTQAQLDSNGVSLGGTFSINFKATDGINIVPHITNFTLTLAPPPITNSRYTALLIGADSASGNNIIRDASSNDYPITISNASEILTGSVSPYRHGGYSWNGYHPNTYATTTIGTIGTNEFTIECWVYWPTVSGPEGIFEINTQVASSSQTNTISVFTRSSTYSYNWAFATNGTQVNSTTPPTANTWHHVALVRNSSNLITLYIDGVSLITRTDATNIQATTLTIGRYYNTSYNTNGYIHDFRIVNGTAIYTSNFTPPTEKLEAIANTDLLTCRLGWFKDESTNARAISTPSVSGLNSGTIAISPYDNNEYNDSDFGGSISFHNGSFTSQTRYFYAPGIKLYPRSTSWTLELWSRIDASDYNTTVDWDLIDAYASGSNGRWLFGTYAGKYRLFPSSVNYSTVAPGLDKWEHIVITHNGSNNQQKVYINGDLQITTTAAYEFQDREFYISSGRSGTRNWPGSVADVRFTKGSILYNSNFVPPTSPVSSSGATFHIKGNSSSVFDKVQKSNLRLRSATLTGSTTQVKFSDTKSIYFPGGTDDVITIGDGDDFREVFKLGTDSWTIDGWFWFDNFSATRAIIQVGRDNGALAIDTTTGGELRIIASGVSLLMTTNSSITAQTWTHIAVTFTDSDNTVRVFIDGSLDSNTATKSTAWDYSSALTVQIGARFFSNSFYYHFIGYMQDFRLTKGLVRYTGNYTPPTAPVEG